MLNIPFTPQNLQIIDGYLSVKDGVLGITSLLIAGEERSDALSYGWIEIKEGDFACCSINNLILPIINRNKRQELIAFLGQNSKAHAYTRMLRFITNQYKIAAVFGMCEVSMSSQNENELLYGVRQGENTFFTQLSSHQLLVVLDGMTLEMRVIFTGQLIRKLVPYFDQSIGAMKHYTSSMPPNIDEIMWSRLFAIRSSPNSLPSSLNTGLIVTMYE